MRHKSKVLLGVVLVAIALVALSAGSAFATSPYSVSLGISRTSGVYGSEFVITPTLNGTETVVGDTYTLQALQSDGVTWSNFGEGLKVDETGTVIPQYLGVDESFLPWYTGVWMPMQFKVIYKTPRSKDASGNQIAYPGDNTVAFQVKTVKKVKIGALIPKTVRRNKGFHLNAQTSPDTGIGAVAVSISKPGTRTQSFRMTTDDSGYATVWKKLGKRGKYTVRLRWLGNNFSAPSSTVTTHVTVK